MRIDLHPGQGCFISEGIGDLHEMKKIRANETVLVLAKIRLGKVSRSHIRESSDDLMVDLANELGETITSYLTVQLTYKHSGFSNYKKQPPNSVGLISHLTRIQTEATAVIGRLSPNSVWSPRASLAMSSPLSENPLLHLIEIHFSVEQAREARKKLVNDQAPIPFAKRLSTLAGSSEETVKPGNHEVEGRLGSAILAPASLDISTGNEITPKHFKEHLMPSANPLTAYIPRPNHEEEVDPARKIWTEMRQHSRGGRRNLRNSISTDHYSSFDNDASPSWLRSGHISSSGHTSVSTISNGMNGNWRRGDSEHVDEERTRIMEVALRNKRSVGAETLRSIAPSVKRSVGRAGGSSKGGQLSSVGLGAGRNWGWGGSWW